MTVDGVNRKVPNTDDNGWGVFFPPTTYEYGCEQHGGFKAES
jgi:hypothetical protein